MDRHFRGMSLSESRALANVKIAINLSYVSSYVLFVILHFFILQVSFYLFLVLLNLVSLFNMYIFILLDFTGM